MLHLNRFLSTVQRLTNIHEIYHGGAGDTYGVFHSSVSALEDKNKYLEGLQFSEPSTKFSHPVLLLRTQHRTNIQITSYGNGKQMRNAPQSKQARRIPHVSVISVLVMYFCSATDNPCFSHCACLFILHADFFKRFFTLKNFATCYGATPQHTGLISIKLLSTWEGYLFKLCRLTTIVILFLVAIIHFLNLLLDLLGTSEQTGSSGSDETSLLTRDSLSRDGRSLTNMLVVTTTMGMVDGVHGNTSSLGPRVSLDLVLVEGSAGLEQGLIDSSTTGNNTDDTSSSGGDDLLGSGRKLDSGLALIGVVADDNDVVTGSSANGTSVTGVLLNVGEDGTLGDGAKRENVTDVQGSLLTGVDELSSVDTLVSDEGLNSLLVLVGVSEDDLGEGSTTTGVMDDLLDNTSDVSVSLGVVEISELSSALSEPGVGGEDRTSTLSLVSNDTTHC